MECLHYILRKIYFFMSIVKLETAQLRVEKRQNFILVPTTEFRCLKTRKQKQGVAIPGQFWLS